jgi:hypothetical protein
MSEKPRSLDAKGKNKELAETKTCPDGWQREEKMSRHHQQSPSRRSCITERCKIGRFFYLIMSTMNLSRSELKRTVRHHHS